MHSHAKENNAATRQATIQKAKRLAALAQRSDNPHEAALAARRLRDLLYHHGIEAAELGAENRNAPTYSHAAEADSLTRVEKYMQIIGISAALMTDTEMIITRYRNWKDQPGRRHAVYGFAGLAPNVAAAVELNTYFLECAHRWLSQRAVTHARQTAGRKLEYLHGVAEGIYLCCLVDRAKHAAQEEAPDSATALMVISARAAAKAMVEERQAKRERIPERETMGAAFFLGVGDGRRVGARRPVAELS